MTLETAPARARRALPARPHPFALAALLVLLLAVGVAALLTYGGEDATTDGSGVAVSETRSTAPFSAVELAGTLPVRITAGSNRSVVVHADDNLVDRVTTAVRADVLTVSTRGSFTTTSPMYVEVAVPALRAVTLAGTGTIDLHNVVAQELRIELARAGTGSVTASGTVRRLEAVLAGTGDLRLGMLEARAAAVTLSGTGQIQTHVSGTLEATLTGNGAILYSGSPARIVQSVTGTGVVAPG